MRNRFDRQLLRLNQEMIDMGSLCEEMITAAAKIVATRDKELMDDIVTMEEEINQKERDIERICMKLLMQQQPVASDLRVISAAMKMVSDMERIGDQACDITGIVKKDAEVLTIRGNTHLDKMAKATISMVSKSIQSFIKQNLVIAHEVIEQDDIVDELFNRVKKETISLIHEDPGKGEECVAIVMIAKYFERIGDHASNIAEWVEFAIFVVEDDPNIRELVTYTLQSTGFDACGFENGSEFLKALSDGEKPELVLLDIMLPGEDGISILGKLRKKSATRDLPIIMMTAKGTEYDNVLGLDSGADDYITKPFGMMELVSRVKAVLRRSSRNEKKDEIIVGQLKIYPNKHKVKSCGNEVTLTNKEFKLLCLLVESKGNVLNRDQLLTNIWGYDFDGETRTVDVHIRSLRQKLGECGKLIETVRGIGYRIGGNES